MCLWLNCIYEETNLKITRTDIFLSVCLLILISINLRKVFLWSLLANIAPCKSLEIKVSHETSYRMVTIYSEPFLKLLYKLWFISIFNEFHDLRKEFSYYGKWASLTISTSKRKVRFVYIKTCWSPGNL